MLAWVFGINLAAFAVMVTGSVASGSSALLSGTLDNLGDALTYALSLAVVGASARAKARVAMVKGLLIFGAALVVAVQIAWRLSDMQTPVASTMSVAAVVNLAANAVCLKLLTPFRGGDVNMSSSWECSRNDVVEGVAVIGAAVAVGAFDSPWPDLLVAVVLLAVFLRSAGRVLRGAWRELARQSPVDTASGTGSTSRQVTPQTSIDANLPAPPGTAHRSTPTTPVPPPDSGSTKRMV